jgi:uncharacterized Zn finger protein
MAQSTLAMVLRPVPGAEEDTLMTNGEARIALSQLRAWAGEAVFKRGQDYEVRGRVRELAATAEGALVAWVQGSQRYATRVTLRPDQLATDCTCPYGGTCKHAVAVALAYLSRPEQAPPLPIVPATDPRLVLLERQAAAAAMLDSQAALSVQPGAEPAHEPALQAFLTAHTQAELVALLIELAQRFPEVRDALAVRQMLSSDDAGQLEAEVLGRIIAASAEPDWHNRWDDDGNTPDYGPVYDGLKLLLDRGHADAVVRLGEHLLEAGIGQVEQSHDEGETAIAVASCLSVVFKALPSSSLEPAEQITWAIDALLRDSYDLCHGAQEVLKQPYPPAAWSTVADVLLSRLDSLPAAVGDFLREYRRRQVTDLAILALKEAGRDDEIIPLCEREAQAGSGYQRLVERLLAAGRSAEAEQWARTGIVATARQHPGIASALREVLCTLRGEAGDWAMVAALRAEVFFDSPSLAALRALEAAAERAEVGREVRAAALHYLETGQPPQRVARSVGGASLPAWPLPDTGIPPAERHHPLQFPQLGLLIELAIGAGRPADVLRWYDRRSAVRYAHLNDDTVADAVAQAYPERAAAIWQQLAEGRIAQTSPAAYEEAALFLRKLRRVWAEHGKAKEWRSYVEGLRAMNRRKRRLMETLDALLHEAV